MSKVFKIFALAVSIFFSIIHFGNFALAQELNPEAKASSAVAEILFNEDADEFSTYRVNGKGFVNITFASNTPDAVYSNLLNRLKSHPDINGVLAGKGGPACRRF